MATWVEAFGQSGIDMTEVKVGFQINRNGDQLMHVVPSPNQQRRREISAFRLELFRRDSLPRPQALPAALSAFMTPRA